MGIGAGGGEGSCEKEKEKEIKKLFESNGLTNNQFGLDFQYL